MALIGLLKRKGPSGFGYNSTAEDVTEGLDLRGKTYVVTGATSGLGTEAVRVLAKRGAKVIATGRTVEKAREATQGFGDVVPVALELSEPSSARGAADTIRGMNLPIDGIIANAGVMALPTRETKYGYELQFFTNHVGHFLLVTGLVDRLTDTGRVVMLSSGAHRRTYPEGIRLDDLGAERGYSPWEAYGQSKLSNLLFAKALAKRLKPGQTANAVHPGVIATNLGRHMSKLAYGTMRYVGGPLFLKNVPQGASTEVYVATHPDAAKITGQYWQDCNVSTPSAWGQDDALAEKLWTKTEEIVRGLAA